MPIEYAVRFAPPDCIWSAVVSPAKFELHPNPLPVVQLTPLFAVEHVMLGSAEAILPVVASVPDVGSVTPVAPDSVSVRP